MGRGGGDDRFADSACTTAWLWTGRELIKSESFIWATSSTSRGRKPARFSSLGICGIHAVRDKVECVRAARCILF